ncbi:hypothetical protein BT63DRAFT_419841 [Microthyrium microscopicum]|uniref:Isomerase YbhE n=1 Tax=Microthyrium microscopicum TaxID=703497 RepID=A0A6A6UUE5_9PEZI|nr:hypothetical protein BT63DRAFT_419841 [Microthyrium microscopicum]
MISTIYGIFALIFINQVCCASFRELPDVPKSKWIRREEAPAGSKATRLFVSSYEGTVTTVELTLSDASTFSKHPALTIHKTASNEDCGDSPTWLSWDSKRRTLYCLNEQIDTSKGRAATLTQYNVGSDGQFSDNKIRPTFAGGPVHGVVFHPIGEDEEDEPSYAVAHYAPGYFTSYDPHSRVRGRLSLDVGPPGPTERQQELVSSGHQIILDPGKQGQVLVPDLSQDLVHIFQCTRADCWRKGTVAMPPGTGPRHGTFWISPDRKKTFFFIGGEISNLIEGYSVDRSEDGSLKFTHVSTTNAVQLPMQEEFALAEIAVSPDNAFLIVSNRGNNATSVDVCEVTGPRYACESAQSDTIVTFALNGTGVLTSGQTWPSGGVAPRAFALNRKGDIMAVGTKAGLVLLERNVSTGKLGQIMADLDFDDQVTGVVWDDSLMNYPSRASKVPAYQRFWQRYLTKRLRRDW